MKRLILTLFLISSVLSPVFADGKLSLISGRDSVTEYFKQQLFLYPQEKIYAQIDRTVYLAGEDIWFRAYLVNAVWHFPDTTSRYVYAELITPENRVESRIRIRLKKGAYYGHIPLSERLPEGDYKLRFYTRFLENSGKEYFFERPIYIGTLATFSGDKVLSNRKRTTENYHVSFFPEGGSLIPGIPGIVGFKAINDRGLGEDITGVVVSENGDTINFFSSSHLGMGNFTCIAYPDVRLFAVCRNEQGIEKRIELPGADPEAVSLHISRLRDKIYVTVHHIPEKRLSESLFLTVSARGNLLYADWWKNSLEGLALDGDILLPGVIQILLSDGYGNPVSERLIFHHSSEEELSASFSTAQPFYEGRQLVEATIFLTNPAGEPVKGDFSVSITDDRDVKPDSCVHIFSALLLTSEIKGHIESPAYYFRNISNEKLQQLDNLMLTQGWSRYQVSSILKNNLQYPLRPKETSMELTGILKGGLLMNRKAEKYAVTLVSMNPFFSLQTHTDDQGIFRFTNFEVPDSLEFLLQGRTPKGGKRVEVIPDAEIYPSLLPFIPMRENEDTLLLKNYFRKADNQLLLTKGIRTIHLSDVVVKAPRPDEKPGLSFFSSPMNRIYRSDYIEQLGPTNIYDLFTYLGLFVDRENGEKKVYFMQHIGEGSPVIMVNDFKVDSMEVDLLYPRDIQEIELTSDPVAIVGPESVFGAIFITIKDPEFNPVKQNEWSMKTLTPLGFQIEKEFYSPVYDVIEKKEFIDPDLRTTIYWNPAVHTDEHGKANINFYTAENFKTYSVVIEGVTADGCIIYMKEQIKGK